MSRLKFRHIEGFRAVLQAGTATGAASLLNVTQPAISQLMTEMEAATGFALFDRRGGRLVPTPNAVLLFDEVERCYTGLDHLNAFCSRLEDSAARSVVIATVPSMALTLVPKAIGRYVSEARQDYFSLFPRHSDEALRMAGSQKADLGFGSKHVTAPGIHCEPVSRYEAVCALPQKHPLASRDVVHAADLDGVPFIIMSRSEGVHELVEDVFQREGVRVHPVGECSMATAACCLVQNGVGVTLVDHGAAAVFINEPVVLKRFVPAVPVTFYAYWLESAEPPLWRKKFIELLKDEAEQMHRRLDLYLDSGGAESVHNKPEHPACFGPGRTGLIAADG